MTGKYTVAPTATRLEITIRGYSDRYSDLQNSELKKVAAYINTDAKATQPVTVWKKRAELFLQLNNLFDRDYSSHYGYPDEGFRAGVGINLNY